MRGKDKKGADCNISLLVRKRDVKKHALEQSWNKRERERNNVSQTRKLEFRERSLKETSTLN